MDQTLLYAMIAVGIMLVVGFPVHEFSHALAAYRLGDSTARWQGRLTLDPRVHFDTVGGLMLVLSALLSRGSFFFGYAKPTPVNPMNLSGGRRGEALVAAAGPVSNLVMAAIVAVPLRLVIDSPELALQVQASEPLRLIVNVAYYFIVINVMLCLFNLLPVPPLDGWRVLMGLVPPQTAWQLRAIEIQYGPILSMGLLLLVFLFGNRIIGPISDAILSLLLGDLSRMGWWSAKVGRFRRHLTGRISPVERATLEERLTPAKLHLFDSMHPADQRHGLDVAARLRAEGHRDPDLLDAALFHDAAKGPSVGVLHRVAWSLAERHGERVLRLTRPLPGFDHAFDRMRHHAERSASLALAAGCSIATADLIRDQATVPGSVAGRALRLADEAS